MPSVAASKTSSSAAIVLSSLGVVAAIVLGLRFGTETGARITALLARIPADTLIELAPPSVSSIVIAVRLEAAAVAAWAISWSLSGPVLLWERVLGRLIGLVTLVWLLPWILLLQRAQAYVTARGGGGSAIALPALAIYVLMLMLQLVSVIRAVSVASR